MHKHMYLEFCTNTTLVKVHLKLLEHFGCKLLQKFTSTRGEELDGITVQRISVLFQKTICIIKNLSKHQVLVKVMEIINIL